MLCIIPAVCVCVFMIKAGFHIFVLLHLSSCLSVCPSDYPIDPPTAPLGEYRESFEPGSVVPSCLFSCSFLTLGPLLSPVARGRGPWVLSCSTLSLLCACSLDHRARAVQVYAPRYVPGDGVFSETTLTGTLLRCFKSEHQRSAASSLHPDGHVFLFLRVASVTLLLGAQSHF